MVADLLNDAPVDYDERAVSAACAQVRSVCGWHIAPVETTYVPVDVPPSGTVVLPSLRVVSVNSVICDGRPVTFAFDADLQELYLGRRGQRHRAVVSLTHGYDSCPEDLREAVVTLAKAGYAEPRVKSDTTGPFRTEWFDEGQAVISTLARYSLPVFA